MSKNLPYIIPATPTEVEESFATYQTTHQFYHEIRERSKFRGHCDWYYTTAMQQRQELEKMRGELNILRWFRRS